jgi:hypothetical protein
MVAYQFNAEGWMSSSNITSNLNIDPEVFQAEVVNRAAELYADLLRSDALGARRKKSNDKQVDLMHEAADLLQRPTVRQQLCRPLRSVSEDIREVAKVVGAALLPLSLTPAAVIPVSAVLFGAVAVMIVRAGISSVCAGVE